VELGEGNVRREGKRSNKGRAGGSESGVGVGVEGGVLFSLCGVIS